MEDRQKILIVDDKKENLFTLEKVLRATDTKIIKAISGNDALKSTLSHEFALAILDVQMPGMDGYELAEHLRGEKKTRHLPIIFMSAVYSDDYYVFKGYDAGAVDYLVKPYNPKIFLSKVKVFLQLDRQKTELLQMLDIEKSRNHLENILMSAADLVIVVSKNHLVEITNRAALSLLGYTHDELVGMHIGKLFEEDQYNSWIHSLATEKTPEAHAKRDTAGLNIETTIMTTMGVKIPVLLSLSALRNSTGETQGIVLVAVDITERKLTEKALQESERLQGVLEMAGAVSHELNQPLMVISGYSELISNGLSKDDSLYEKITKILEQVNRLGRITHRLMNVTRYETKEYLQEKIVDIDRSSNEVN